VGNNLQNDGYGQEVAGNLEEELIMMGQQM